MKSFLRRPYSWSVCYGAWLVIFTAFILLDTLVIPRSGTQAISYSSAQASEAQPYGTQLSGSHASIAQASASAADPVITESSYKDDNISITIQTVYEYSTYFYVADIQISDISYLKTAFANGTYGRNIKQKTSVIAEDNQAIFAINGDYYGFRNSGFVLRNKVLYRSAARSYGDDEALVIDSSGDFSIIHESRADAEDLLNAGVFQIFSFGPALVDNGEIAVSSGEEVGQSMSSNPRTAVGQVSALHYIFIVSDGRTEESAGLSLMELACEFQERDCAVAYNLDGGGSSSMWFNGEIVNCPTTDGRKIAERSVSDIVYIGY